MHKFIENIIGFSLKNHVFILFMTGVLFVAGIACYQNTSHRGLSRCDQYAGENHCPMARTQCRRGREVRYASHNATA